MVLHNVIKVSAASDLIVYFYYPKHCISFMNKLSSGERFKVRERSFYSMRSLIICYGTV